MDSTHRCYRCEHCWPHFDQIGWGFYGCHGGNLHGTLVGEIDVCPDKDHKLVSEEHWETYKKWKK